ATTRMRVVRGAGSCRRQRGRDVIETHEMLLRSANRQRAEQVSGIRIAAQLEYVDHHVLRRADDDIGARLFDNRRASVDHGDRQLLQRGLERNDAVPRRLLGDEIAARMVGGEEQSRCIAQARHEAIFERSSTAPTSGALSSSRSGGASANPWRRASAITRANSASEAGSPTPELPAAPSRHSSIVSARHASWTPPGNPYTLPAPKRRRGSGNATRPPEMTVMSLRARSAGDASGGVATSQTIAPARSGARSRIGSCDDDAESTSSQSRKAARSVVSASGPCQCSRTSVWRGCSARGTLAGLVTRTNT